MLKCLPVLHLVLKRLGSFFHSKIKLRLGVPLESPIKRQVHFVSEGILEVLPDIITHMNEISLDSPNLVELLTKYSYVNKLIDTVQNKS